MSAEDKPKLSLNLIATSLALLLGTGGSGGVAVLVYRVDQLEQNQSERKIEDKEARTEARTIVLQVQSLTDSMTRMERAFEEQRQEMRELRRSIDRRERNQPR